MRTGMKSLSWSPSVRPRLRPDPHSNFASTDRASVAGPALLELPGSTCWVPEGWNGKSNASGAFVLTRT